MILKGAAFIESARVGYLMNSDLGSNVQKDGLEGENRYTSTYYCINNILLDDVEWADDNQTAPRLLGNAIFMMHWIRMHIAPASHPT